MNKMKKTQNFLYSLPAYLLSTIASVLTIAQAALAFFLRGQPSPTVEWAGWICLWVSAIFGILPIITFRAKGDVPRGQSYMKTTRLVDTGIYAIVRHPQGGTAWLLINLAILLIVWHWTSTTLGLLSMALAYVDTFKADQYCIQKFGDAYRRYIQAVPRVNFVAGIIRLVQRRRRESGEG